VALKAVLPSIERYEITEEIGHGGMATVYRARDSRLDRWVAVKVMHPHLRGTEQARARFSREARAVARLRHPAILEIYDYSGNLSQDAFIATELLTGPTLRVFVDQVGEVPPEIAACVGVELAGALAAAHAQGIVHRDVKPENVLLHENRALKLTDFGIADMVDPTMSAMTATGQILGSPAHMAPEQVEGGEVDARSDIFALGTILYWLATGSLPFSGKNPHQVLKRVADCNPVDPLLLKPAIGHDFRALIMRCLARDPAGRYASALELSAELSRLLRDSGIDDAHAQLEAFLQAPREESELLRRRVVLRLLERARVAVAARDRAAALPLLDRVLALEDGQPDALALIDTLDRASRRRIAARAGFAVVALALLAGMWAAFAPRSDPARAVEARADKPSTPPATPATLSKPKPPDEPAVAVADPQQKPEPAAPRPRPAARPPASRPGAGSAPRTVVFDPDPVNVQISVDGTPPRDFGPSFRMVDLPPGPHTFRFIGAFECCEDRVVTVEVPAGPGQTVVDPKLPLRPARLYVNSNVPADVAVDDGLVTGRALNLVQVPILGRRMDEKRRISVTAQGYEPYTGTVHLTAGQLQRVNVELKPSVPH
jgi:hypothetical protein